MLQREKLYLKLSKCEFGKNSLIYLGYIVGGSHLKIDPVKIDVIVKWPRPQNMTEFRIFWVWFSTRGSLFIISLLFHHHFMNHLIL